MYTGRLWFDFKSEEEKSHYAAEVTRCIFLDDGLNIEFSGSDEGHHFTGNCKLQRCGDTYAGEGGFAYAGKDEVSSSVEVTLEKDGSEISLHGTWIDQGETESYQIEVELSET